MHKQVIMYENFDGETVTEDIYFNVARAKIIDMALTGEAQELFETIQKAVKEEDGAEVIRLVRELIKISYGEKQADGKTFRQNEELSSDFLQSAPFDAMFYDFMMHPTKALEFIEAIFPAQLMADAIEKAKEQGKSLEQIADEGFPAFKRPEPQDRLPKREIKDITVVDAQLTDTPLPGQETRVVGGREFSREEFVGTNPSEALSAEADLAAFREWQRQTGRA